MSVVYHLCTEEGHPVIFRDEEDYSVGWNFLAVAAYAAGVNIYCFCLMSNHIHLIVHGTEVSSEDFFLKYKNLLGRHLSKRYGDSGLNGWKEKLIEISNRQAFLQEVGYILRNPLKAGVDTPWTYRWSSCLAYFNNRPDKSIAAADLSVREKFRNTTYPIPGDLKLNESSGISGTSETGLDLRGNSS